MKLFLSQVDDRRWQGLVDINGETFKVVLFPGSATEPWVATLQVGGWVELTSDGRITAAITKAFDEQKREHLFLKPQAQGIAEILQGHPELLDEILKAISGKEDSNDDRTV